MSIEKIKNGFFALALMVLLVQGCCKPDPYIDNPCGDTCYINEECVSGTCQCVENTVRVGKTCFSYDSDSYFGRVDSCHCIKGDMLVNLPRLTYTTYNGYTAIGAAGIEIRYENWEGKAITFGSYFYRPNQNDSAMLYNIDIVGCLIDTTDCAALLAGTFIGNDTFEGWIKWYPWTDLPMPDAKIIDSCHVVLVKPKR